MKRKSKWIISAISTLVISICLLFGSKVSYQDAKAEKYVLSGVKNTYCIGETLIVKEETDIDVNGTNVKGKSPKLITPSGVVYGEGSYVLTEPGEYQLYYFANYENKEISASKTIVVSEYSWGYSERSSAEYGELTLKQTIAGQEDRVAEGIILDLAKGDTFTFAKKLNIAGLKELDICQIYPMLREKATDEASAAMVTCKIVDSYNPDLFVEVYVWAAPQGGYYCGAGANNQTIGGLLDHKEEGSILFEGVRWRFSNKPRYSTNSAFGKLCYGNSPVSSAFARYGGMKFSMDLETNRIYLTNNMGGLVTDLDSEELYGENLFNGFISDEVYAIIECQGYIVPSVNLQIESLLGFKGEDLQVVNITDKKAPEVDLLIDKTDEGGVYVVKDKEFVIPSEVVVSDSSRVKDLQINVYYNYGTSRQTLVYSKDEKFVPNKEGKYTVEYKATDIYGNSGIATLDLIVVSGENGIEIEETKLDRLVLLQENIFPQIEATGKNKEVSCEVYIKTPDGEKAVLGDRLAYVPEQAGEYEIVYTFKDNVYTRIYSYKLTAVLAESSFIQKEEPKLPVYFIKDASYTFEPVYVKTIEGSGLVEKATTVQISVDGGEYQVIDSAKSVKIEGNSRVCVKYTYANEVVGLYERDILDVGYANKSGRNYAAYFQGDYTAATATTVGFEYAFAGKISTEEMRYANLVSLANFKLAFTVAQEQDNFKKINIILREVTNPQNYLTISYEKTENDVVYTVKETYNGFEVVNQTLKGFGQMAATRAITYSSGVLTNNNGDMVEIKPFAADLCVLIVQVEDISSESVIKIDELNNQKFSKIYREQGAMLSIELPNRNYKLGEVYNIKPAELSSVANVANAKDITLTVTTPNGEIAKDSKGTLLENVPANQEYVLPLSISGHYHFSYIYSCELNTGVKKEQTPMILTVVDTIPPEAYFEGLGSDDVLSVKVGHTHKIRSYVVNDNATKLEDMWVQVSVYSAAGTMLSVNKDTYTFVKAGKYVVYLWCADADGNVTTAYYNVWVE